jgi:hypothetical protein
MPEGYKDSAVQRTWDMQISCTCSRPAHCPRFHGLPLLTAEFNALLPGIAEHQKERDRLYERYERIGSADTFAALTAPFNSYRRD